MSSMNPISN